MILGGDSDGPTAIPDRDTVHPQFDYQDVPTDVYYISSKDWDANDDGVFGDWQTDLAALQWTDSQACIGRIPVRTADQVATYTKKVIAYESAYPQQSFAMNFVQTCPVPQAYAKLITSARLIKEQHSTIEPHLYYAHATSWDRHTQGDHELSPDGFINLINQQRYGKLHVHGHGLLKLWVLEHEQPITVEALPQLTNNQAYPIITTVSCHTGRFDHPDDPSVTESMLRLEEAGAIAIIAPCREGVPVFINPQDMQRMHSEGLMDGTTQLLTDFWLAGLTQNLTVGEALAQAKQQQVARAEVFYGHHWLLSEMNLLGDPSIPVRSDDPITPLLNVPNNIPLGKQTTLEIETGAPGAQVCLWQGDSLYLQELCDDQGNISISIQPQHAMPILVTISPTVNVVQKSITVN